MYNYCSAESATVTVEPAQDKLDKHPMHPSQHFIRGPLNKSHNANNQSIIASNSLSVRSFFYLHVIPNTASFISSLPAATPLSYWSVVLGGQCYLYWSVCRSRCWYMNCCLEEEQLKEKRKKQNNLLFGQG